jgi:hypothetical protein
MVCRRMGLLDDAIREHLELKRLRGADPGMVASEEHEAFGPAGGDESTNADDDSATHGDVAAESASPQEDDRTHTGLPDRGQDFSNVGQETAELDMRAVLDDESGHDIAPVGPVAVGPVGGRPSAIGAPPEQGATDDSLEWEMPGDVASMGADGHAEDERLADTVSDRPRPDEPIEDVLEETPDFLRDTPEQERLWFEQRPPRDFDFDK